MVIVIREGAKVEIEDPADTKSFKVVAEVADERMARSAIEAVGRWEDRDTAWIAVAAVRELAATEVSSDWEGEFEAMLDFAQAKGWLDEDRSEIQAHIEWETPVG